MKKLTKGQKKKVQKLWSKFETDETKLRFEWARSSVKWPDPKDVNEMVRMIPKVRKDQVENMDRFYKDFEKLARKFQKDLHKIVPNANPKWDYATMVFPDGTRISR